MILSLSLFTSFLTQYAIAKDDGLALTPPLGWRSWNLYLGNVHQDEMVAIMDGMVRRTRKNWAGKLVSLCDLGYCDVGLDDTWQACNSPKAAKGMHYHDAEGNPLVNLDRFPSLLNMTKHAKELGLSPGWYSNNCACNDHCNTETGECDMQIRQDAQALLQYGFSSLKIDGCGSEKNLTLWDKYITKYSDKPVLIEHCQANDRKLGDGCPEYHFYRTSADIRNNYASIMHNLASIEKYRGANSSYPGCWAYADMLQVGVRHGLNILETRSHFAGWAIVSSPLVLSHDVNDDTVMDAIWDVISNTEIIGINQAYVGESGGAYDSATETTMLHSCDGFAFEAPVHQYLSKPIEKNRIAVLLMNSGNETQELTANFADIPYADCEHKDDGSHCDFLVRDIWDHVDMGRFRDFWSVSVESHDTAFIVLEKVRGGGGQVDKNTNKVVTNSTAQF
jgi:alpha-galactosidase